jgi:hypothetical protein
VEGLGTASYVSSLSLVSTTVGIQAAAPSTVGGLGNIGYVSSLSLKSTVEGLGTTGYVSSLSLRSTVEGLGRTGYVSTASLVSTTAGIQTVSFLTVGSNFMTYSLTSSEFLYTNAVSVYSILTSSIGVNNTQNAANFSLDVNGPSQSAIYYSSLTTGGTLTITMNTTTFGIFYNIGTAGTYTVNLPSTQPASNIGKYNVLRNNTGSALTITVTGSSGITSPVTCASLQSVTFIVATTSTYALF